MKDLSTIFSFKIFKPSLICFIWDENYNILEEIDYKAYNAEQKSKFINLWNQPFNSLNNNVSNNNKYKKFNNNSQNKSNTNNKNQG